MMLISMPTPWKMRRTTMVLLLPLPAMAMTVPSRRCVRALLASCTCAPARWGGGKEVAARAAGARQQATRQGTLPEARAAACAMLLRGCFPAVCAAGAAPAGQSSHCRQSGCRAGPCAAGWPCTAPPVCRLVAASRRQVGGGRRLAVVARALHQSAAPPWAMCRASDWTPGALQPRPLHNEQSQHVLRRGPPGNGAAATHQRDQTLDAGHDPRRNAAAPAGHHRPLLSESTLGQHRGLPLRPAAAGLGRW